MKKQHVMIFDGSCGITVYLVEQSSSARPKMFNLQTFENRETGKSWGRDLADYLNTKLVDKHNNVIEDFGV